MATDGPATADLSLSAPQAVTPESTPSLIDSVKLDPETARRLDAVVNSYLDALLRMDPNSEAFKGKVNAIHALGSEDIKQSASVSNRMLDRPVGAISRLSDKNSTVPAALLQLRRTVEDLDPSRRGMLRRRRMPVFGNRVQDYFRRYQSAQGHLNAIIQALYRGQDELRKDNASIEQEKGNLWAIMDRLRQYLYLAGKLDSALEARIRELDATDPERARTMREDLLFYVRQKSQDLATQLAVSAQGYLALELVRKNNLELVKGVDRATTTTVSALRTAVIAAQALGTQRLVLDQIGALNTTTSDMIESTSRVLKEQSATVHEQAASATISVEKLQAAFQNLYETMDTIDAYKLQALEHMRQTVDALTREVAKAQTYLDRAQKAPAAEAITAVPDDLRIPAGRP
jgi:uncharacterized protein YaaN involved in tellurite resistance